MNGIVIVNKEKGYTSMDVVACIRGIFGIRRAGHTGTLDPDATGVLPVCIGSGTALVSMLTDSDKTYRAVMRLGIATDTQDISGRVTGGDEQAAARLAAEEVRAAIESFEGGYDQIPPMYSAVKIGGKKLVDLARQGREVEREPRHIQIYRIAVEHIELPYIEMTVECSKGTYIRTLCHDIGARLGCGACMTQLTRMRAAGFSLEQAYTLGELERLRDSGQLESTVISAEDYFGYLPAYTTEPQQDRYVMNGNKLTQLPQGICGDGQMLRIYTSDHIFRAVYRYDAQGGEYRVVRMFL